MKIFLSESTKEVVKPLCEVASKREARFANGRGNLFRARFAATHGTCGFVNGRPVNSGETIVRSSE